jgi:hypothetical protein
MPSSWRVVVALLSIMGCSRQDAPPPAAPSQPPPAAAPVLPGSAPAPASTSAFPSDFPATCIEYKDAIDQLTKCDKLPPASKDAMKEAYQTMLGSWKEGTMAPAAIQSAAEACAAGRDALLQAVAVCNK